MWLDLNQRPRACLNAPVHKQYTKRNSVFQFGGGIMNPIKKSQRGTAGDLRVQKSQFKQGIKPYKR